MDRDELRDEIERAAREVAEQYTFRQISPLRPGMTFSAGTVIEVNDDGTYVIDLETPSMAAERITREAL